MQLQIITPEHVIFDGEIDAITLPGKDGEFQILNNHAPIVATLGEGTKIHGFFKRHNSEIELAPALEITTSAIA